MTPAEFKSWFDGFTEALTGVPTKAQWARIKERVAEIDGRAITERVYVDRYWQKYREYDWYRPMYTSNTVTPMPKTAEVWCSTTAMAALGRADAQALAK